MRQNLGQHFLRDERILLRIASTLLPVRPATILEVGPGHGELTEKLVAILPNGPEARLVCIERDPALAESLRAKYTNEKRVSVREGDVRTVLPELARDGSLGEMWYCAGNIPYYLTGELMRLLGDLPVPPVRTVFTIQKEVAERVTATPPRGNQLAAHVRGWAIPELAFKIPRSAFVPPPDVDSAVIVLLKTGNPAGKSYHRIVASLFRQPRKTIRNNLRDAGLTDEEIGEVLASAAQSPSDRPGTIPFETLLALGSTLSLPTDQPGAKRERSER